MAADVADDDAEAAVAHGDIVEVVAAGRLGGVRGAADVEAGRRKRRRREELLLDLPSQADLLARPPSVAFRASKLPGRSSTHRTFIDSPVRVSAARGRLSASRVSVAFTEVPSWASTLNGRKRAGAKSPREIQHGVRKTES